MCVCKKGTKRNLELNTLKSYQPQYDGPAVYVIAQQYSSATFVSWFHCLKSKIGDILNKIGNVRIAQHSDAFVQPLLQWKAIGIIYPERVFVVLGTLHAPYCQLWPARLYNIFSYHLTNGLKEKVCVRILYNVYLKHFSYLLTPWCRVLLEKLTGLQLVKKFPAFHGTRRFITALTSVRQLSLSWASPIQSIYPYPTSWSSILILSTHLRLGLPNGLLPSGFLTKTIYTPLSTPIRATCPAHLILLDLMTRTILGEEYRSFSSSFCSLLHFPVTSSLLGLNILLKTMFLNTLSFLSSRNVNDQVSHPYKTTDGIN